MTTNIHNKAHQLCAWIDRVKAVDGEVGEIDVRAQVQKRWPDLLPEIQEQIVQAFLKLMRAAYPPPLSTDQRTSPAWRA